MTERVAGLKHHGCGLLFLGPMKKGCQTTTCEPVAGRCAILPPSVEAATGDRINYMSMDVGAQDKMAPPGQFHIGPSAFSPGVKLLSVHDPMSETREKREENKDE